MMVSRDSRWWVGRASADEARARKGRATLASILGENAEVRGVERKEGEGMMMEREEMGSVLPLTL